MGLLALFSFATQKAVEWENPKFEEDFEKRFIDKSFLWLWFSWFGWYVPLGLLFVPFGGELFSFFNRTPVLENFIFTPSGLQGLEWFPDMIEMDRAFVTPLIVTQAMNLLIETFALRLYIKFRISRDERVWRSGLQAS